MVVPSIDHGNSVPDTRVGQLFRACQSFPTAAAHIILRSQTRTVRVWLCETMIATNAAKYLIFSSLGGSIP